MKPDWNNAPDWANFLAMDLDGEWYWFAVKPQVGESVWEPSGGACICAGGFKQDWQGSLERRP